jgi:hypothetical protein
LRIHQNRYYPLVLFFALLLASCSVLKSVPPNDYLFTGGKVVADSGALNKSMRADLKKFIQPKPNSRFLGIPFKLMLYNAVKEPKKPRGLRYKMKYKWGEAPVLLSAVKASAIEKRIGDGLFNVGYLKTQVKTTVDSGKQKASLRFNVTTGDRYTIRNLFYAADSSGILEALNRKQEDALIRKGDYFDLKKFSAERERLANLLKEKGYYYFEPDYLLFRVDSLHQGEADLYITMKAETPDNAKKIWHIGDIKIYGNYSIEKDSVIMRQAGKDEKIFTIIDKKNNYKTSMYDRAVPIRQGQVYSTAMHSLTIERLMNLNTFRFVKIAFQPSADTTIPTLNTRIFLTPAKKQSLRFELSGNSKSNNFLGSELSVNYRNVNLNRGAEILEAKLTGGFDTQVGGQQASSNTYSLTGEVNLYVPRLVPGFRINTMNNPYLPRTVITPGIEYVKRTDLYTFRSLRFSAGYIWKQGKAIEQNLKLIHINSIDPLTITPRFDSILANDAALKASFEKQLIIGSKYLFQYNNTYRAQKLFTYAVDAGINTSGNLAGLLVKKQGDTVGAKKVLGIPLAQFIRLQTELRGYWRLSGILTWANRLIVGVGFAYGNSERMPYAEQFFIGGSSSIRAFRARTLGPGSYHTSSSNYQANESGDVKLELNSELRYNMSRFVKLAAFVDAGNIWYRKEVADKPGSGLRAGELLPETAVGAGLGLRIDASVLVVRFDLAMPLRKPWYRAGERWVLNQVNFGDRIWRKENLVLNIGIGYPF